MCGYQAGWIGHEDGMEKIMIENMWLKRMDCLLLSFYFCVGPVPYGYDMRRNTRYGLMMSAIKVFVYSFYSFWHELALVGPVNI